MSSSADALILKTDESMPGLFESKMYVKFECGNAESYAQAVSELERFLGPIKSNKNSPAGKCSMQDIRRLYEKADGLYEKADYGAALN